MQKRHPKARKVRTGPDGEWEWRDPKPPSERRPSTKRGEVPVDVDALAEVAIGAIGMRKHKCDVKRDIARAAGRELMPKDYERVIARAREILVSRVRAGHEDTKSDAVAFYEAIIRSPAVEPRDKVRAQERLDWIFGNDAKFTGRGPREANLAEVLAEVLKVVPESARGAVIRAAKEAAVRSAERGA
jgi:hypothetical protein